MKLDFILADTTFQSMKAGIASFSARAKENVFENYLILVPETKTLEAEQLLLGNNGAFLNVSIGVIRFYGMFLKESRMIWKRSVINVY